MIDLNKLSVYAKECRDEECDCANLYVHDLEELITRLRESEADAKRYRFMRDMSDKIDVSRFFHIDVSERDAEIDDTMSHEVSDASDRVES